MSIDFTNCPHNYTKTFGGANGKKLSIEYKNNNYMLKFPPVAKLNKNIKYTNSVISEHIGCSIFNMLGVKAQETLLGHYKINNENKLVVACKDLEVDGYILNDFASLRNTVVDSVSGGYDTDLLGILDTIENQLQLSTSELMTLFWDIFIIDAFLGNFDRHNGNWGFLSNWSKKEIKIAPIYDCGSCLYPEIGLEKMKLVMNDKNELNGRLYSYPKSMISINGKKLSYYETLKSNEYKECTESLLKISKRIDLEEINNFIDEINLISDLEKDFYKYILKSRKELILDKAILELDVNKEYLTIEELKPFMKDKIEGSKFEVLNLIDGKLTLNLIDKDKIKEYNISDLIEKDIYDILIEKGLIK